LQQLGFVDPVKGENFSTNSQSSVAMEVLPNMFLNVPISHGLHASPAIRYPGMHSHDSAPTAMKSEQARHLPGPNGLAFPIAHAVQLSSPVLSYPALHKQSLFAVLANMKE
jgi:hypothetical protein